MDVKDLLKIIQVQRHDFLNHLQVISGLVQLGKADRVSEYINSICQDMQLMSRISRLKIPEIAAAVMIGHNLAFEHQITVTYQFETELGETSAPGEILGSVLVEIQKYLFNYMESHLDSRQVNFTMKKNEDNYICRFNVKSSDLAAREAFDNLMHVVEDKLGLDNGRVEITISEGRLDIALIFRVGKQV